MLELAREMLVAVDTLPYPDTLGKMQIRIGLHVGAVFGGVIGIKYPRYSLFGSTLRLAQGLQVGGFVEGGSKGRIHGDHTRHTVCVGEAVGKQHRVLFKWMREECVGYGRGCIYDLMRLRGRGNGSGSERN